MASSILTSRQQDELNKAIIQYLEPLIGEESDLLPKLTEILQVDSSAVSEVIPNYLEKKWSTVLRLQKKIMDLESEVSNMKSIVDSQPSSFQQNGSSDKIDWIPQVTKQVFKTQSTQQINTTVLHPFLPIIVCGCSDGTIIVWNLAVDDTVPEKIIKAHTRAVNRIVWSKAPVDITGEGVGEYVFASCSSDLSIKVWNGSSYKQVRNFLGHEHTVSSLVFSQAHPKILYSVSRDKTFKVWDLVDSTCMRSYVGHSDWVRDIDVINVGTFQPQIDIAPYGDFILTCSNDQSVRLSHAETGIGLSLSIGHGHVVEAVKFLPLYANSRIDKFLEKNESRFPSIPTNLVNESAYTTVLGFKYCVSCGRDNTVRLWLLPPPVLQPHRAPLPSNLNYSQGWLLDTMSGHGSWVKSLAIHPNGRFIFSASDDKTIKIWDLETLVTDGKVKCIRTLTGHDGFVNTIDFASFEVDETLPEGDKLLHYIEGRMRCIFASGSVDNTVRLWR